jgi:fatty-acyl-CoA synthase
VALNPGHTLDYETLANHCRARLAAFKVPKELILREQLPRNPSGKVLKRVLRDELR